MLKGLVKKRKKLDHILELELEWTAQYISKVFIYIFILFYTTGGLKKSCFLLDHLMKGCHLVPPMPRTAVSRACTMESSARYGRCPGSAFRQ